MVRVKKILSRRKVFIILTLLIILFTAFFILSHAAVNNVVSPPRSTLTHSQKKLLAEPDSLGIEIDARQLLNGQVPTLIVTSNGKPSKKGILLREQLLKLDQPITAVESLTLPHANIILLHGRKGKKEDLLPIAERFCALGFRCIIPDLPAHGESPISVCSYGADDFERSIPLSIYTELSSDRTFAQTPFHLWGMSMGGSFLTYAAALDDAPWDSLIIVASFSSFESIFNRRTPSIFREWLAERVKNAGGTHPKEILPIVQAARISTPLLQFHGSKDKLIKLSNGKALFEAFKSTDKEFITVPDANHSNILITPMKVYAKMASFMLGRNKDQ